MRAAVGQTVDMGAIRRVRSLAATVVGYVLLALLAYFAFRIFLGTIYWLMRTVVLFLAIGLLVTLYLKLKAPNDGEPT